MRIEFTSKEKEVFKRLHIEAVILFGSRALGLAGKGSDYDFGILLRDKNVLKSSEKRKKIYAEIYDVLAEKINRLVNIDIVFLEDAPAELQAHAAKYGVPLFQAGRNSFSDFKEYVMNMQADFEPYKRLFEQALLSRL